MATSSAKLPTTDSVGTAPGRKGLFSSRVARRVFLLFILCSFLPLLLFASLSLFKVSAQLEDQARSRLREACKSTGMAVVQRLNSVGDDLQRALGSGSSDVLARLGDAPRELRERLRSRVEWLAVGTADSQLIEGVPPPSPLPALSALEREHLDQVSGLITIGRNNGQAVMILVLGLGVEARPRDQARFLFCELKTSFLWGGDGLLRPNVDLFALTEEGDHLFSTTSQPGVIQAVSSAMRSNASRGQVEVSNDGTPYFVSYRTMFTEPSHFRNFIVAYSQSRETVLAPIASFEELFLLFALLTICTVAAASLIQIRRSLVPITILADATRRVQERDFSARVEITTKDEFRDLGASFNQMAKSLGEYDSTMDALYRIGIALSAEKSSSKLMGLIVEGARHMTSADLVMLHLIDKSGGLRVEHVSYGSKQQDQSLAAFEQELVAGAAQPGTTTGAALAVSTGRTIDVNDISGSDEFDATPYRRLREMLGFDLRSVLCAPMRDQEGEIVGVLELVNAIDERTETIVPFTRDERKISESLASQAAVALAKNRFADELKHMFEALTELIATAIDEKSLYTGAHCRRVPILTMMVADEVCKASTGPCADMSFTSDELYELKLAALLHDCGKVTTPVHIVDKATKLEKIIDRIDLINTRFEVVIRDLRFEHLRRCHATDDESELAELTEGLTRDLEMIARDRQFLSHVNIGREFMTGEAQAAVGMIATRYHWINPEGRRVPFLTEDEIVNLRVSRGTLTAADREIVNHHVVATINMLSRLPFPKNLANVAAIAGAHHEKMDGTGYPAGLTRREISLQGRVLGIADVFEALTAEDRPYKAGKTLSESLHILGTMKESGHLDPDLFQVFVESGVYMRYAKEFLNPAQIDEVDLAKVPGYVLPAPAERQFV